MAHEAIRDMLNQPRSFARELDRLHRRYEYLSEVATRGTSSMAAVRYGGTDRHSKLEDSAISRMEVSDEIEKLEARLLAARRGVRKVAAAMPTPELRQLVLLRYVYIKSWEDVARVLGLSESHVFRMNGEVYSLLTNESR